MNKKNSDTVSMRIFNTKFRKHKTTVSMLLVHNKTQRFSAHLLHLLSALTFSSLDSPQNSCILYIYTDLYTKSWPTSK